MTTLQQEAGNLVETLWRVIAALDGYDADDRRDYAKALSGRLRPLVADLDQAVHREKSRSHAEDILFDIAPIMDVVNGATTKGEMDIFDDATLDRYWGLYTIFRESRFLGQQL
jgi:hypothetical protein